MKMISAFLTFSLAILLFACGKDKFETKPRLEIKDYNSKEIFGPRNPGDPGDVLKIRINYFDKEGDLNEVPIIAIRKRLNLFPENRDLVDTFRTSLPDFPAKDNGEISFQLPYGSLSESTVENDTIIFRFAVTDRAGNNSDTVTSEQIVIHKP